MSTTPDPTAKERRQPTARVEPHELSARAHVATQRPAWATPSRGEPLPWTPASQAAGPGRGAETLAEPMSSPPEDAWAEEEDAAPVSAAPAPEGAAAVAPTSGAGAGAGAAQTSLPPGAIVITAEELAARESAIVASLREPFLAAARRLDEAIVELEQRVHEDVVDLAAKIASTLVLREVRLDRSIMLGIVRRALRLAAPLENVTVKCSEEDVEYLRQHIASIAESEAGRSVDVQVRASEDITPGGCVVTLDGGIVDARNERRLARIVQAVKSAMNDSHEEPTGGPDTGPTGGPDTGPNGSGETSP